ncbi:MAG TPA: hypothetical protein VJV03_09170 [Pyrinomonadaceae bacterium]|nr:hypothetical protein [Pyrinomonadaceae bacterium]
MSRKSKLILFLGVVLIFFLLSGYLMSDDLFFNQLIRANRITTPEEAFAFVQSQTDPVATGVSAQSGLTPRYMLTQRKGLYCDESAIVLATIVHELGYETRLVDLVDVKAGKNSHTILEVHQNGVWKTYDTLQDLQGVTYQQSAATYEPRPVFRAYPGIYNWFVQNNFYLKHLALWLRRIPG